MKKKITTLKRNADNWFSKFIRLRDSNPNGFGQCVTCGKSVLWKSAHCGHFQHRRFLATRYHEQNCHLQCVGCNTFREGEQFIHAKEIDARYGRGTAQELEVLARSLRQLKVHDYEEIISKYKSQSKEIAELKGIEL